MWFDLMENNWQKDYPVIADLSKVESDENSSYNKMARFVGHDKYVVDFGCATGYFAQLLTQKGCTVVGVEINPNAAKIAEQYCEKVIVADLDFISLADILPFQTFDVVVFGDTLEHLRDPWRILEETKSLLKPDGYVVVSIPNVAHGAVRLALLQGRFEYEKYGLLDNTHLRFFTRRTLDQLFEQTGYFVDSSDRTIVPIFSSSEFIPIVDWDDFEPEIIRKIEQEEDSDTLQFIVKAFPVTAEGKFAALSNRYGGLLEQYKQLQLEKQAVQTQLKQAQTDLQQFRERTQVDLQQFQEQTQSDLKQIQEHAQNELQQVQNELQQVHSELNRTQAHLQEVQTELEQQKALASTQAQQLRQHLEANHQLEKKQLQLLQAQGDLIQSQRNQEIQNFRIERLQHKIQQVRERQRRSKANLENTKRELENARNEVEAMKTSKFWRLRMQWLQVKKLFAIKSN